MLPRRSSADRRHERSTRRTGNVGVPDLAFMRLDSIGFAGPCMPCCRTTSGNVDVLFVAQRCCSSTNFLPCNFPSRVRKTRRVSPQLRHSETLAYEEGWSRSWPRLYPRSHPRSVLSAQSSWKRQIGVGSRNDDAAFRVSCSVHRNVVRARVPTLANISWNGTGRIAGGRVGRCTEKHGDTQPVKDAEGREGGGHGSWKSTGTRWKKTERDRTILQDACDFPPVDVFAHTARDEGRENDEENHRDVVDSSNVREVDVDRRTERDPGFCRSLVRCHRKGGGKGGGGGGGGRGGGGKGDERKVCCKDDAFRKSLGYRRERCKGRYTARFQEPIANESYERERGLSTHGPTKVSNSCGRKCGFLLVLYLLAWPLVSSTNPSGQFASRFTRSSSLGPAENLSQYNATQFTSLLSSTIVHQQQDQQQQHQHQHQQQEQLHRQLEEMQKAQEQFVRDLAMDENGRRRRRHEDHQEEQNREERKVRESSSPYRDRETVLESETTHPYNEYSWEVNEINPWLSACDLAGPAPADLQGSCGPPEVARNCPISCSVGLNEKGKDAEFHEVMKMIERMKWRAVDGNAHANNDNGDDKDTDTDVNNDNDDNNQKKKKKKKYNGDNSGKNKEKGEEEFAKDNEMDRVIDETLDSVRVAPEQCLFYLEESHKKDICRDDFGRTSTQSFLTPRENRYWFMSGLRLRHCCEHAVVNALAPGKGGPLENVLNGGQKCVDALDKLLLVDGLAARLHCEFEEVLARYDCAQPYSVIFNCTHCKEAYRKWVCSSLVPYFAHGGPQDSDAMDSWSGSRLRPCRSICQSVEQRCPYLLPGDRAPAYPTQYAGEPTFLCRDPNIPETGEQATRALHSSDEDECCFHACSEETPVSGVCVNCTDRDPRKRGRFADPPTAPHCEINPIQSPQSTGGKHRDAESTDDSLADGDGGDGTSTATAASVSDAVQRLPQGTSLCGSGGVGSMTSVSSADRSTASILPQLFWLFFLLASTLDSVRALPVFRIAGVLVRSIASTGDRKDAGEPGSEGTVRLTGFVARTNDVSACYGAKWLIEKWTACKHRCKSWWCCCWYWWWWRWRRTRLTDTFQWKSGSCSLFIDAASAAAIGVLVEIGLPLRSPPRGSRVSSRLHGCSWRWWWRWWWWCWGCCWWLWRWWWWWWWWKSWRTDRRERMRDRERRVKVNGVEERSEETRRRDRMESLSKNVCHFPVEEDRLETSSRKHPP